MEGLTEFDWTDLHTFLQASRNGTISKTAERLHVDVTTVRRRLATFERAIGMKLFVKSGRSLQLTSAGQRIYSIASGMEELSNEIVRDATDAARELAGVVRVSTMEGFGSFYLAPRLSSFVKQHPRLSIQLVSAQHVLNLSEREADVSINMIRPQHGRLRVRKAGQFSVGLYGAPSYLATYGIPQTKQQLQDHTFLTYVDELVSVPKVRWLPDVIDKPQTPFASTSLVAQFQAACAGSGLVMLPHFMGGQTKALTRVMASDINFVRDWWLVVHQDLQAVPRIRAVIDFICTSMRQDHHVLMS